MKAKLIKIREALYSPEVVPTTEYATKIYADAMKAANELLEELDSEELVEIVAKHMLINSGYHLDSPYFKDRIIGTKGTAQAAINAIKGDGV